MFQVQPNDPAHPIEYVVFVLVGVLGGRFSTFFCRGTTQSSSDGKHLADTNSRRLLHDSRHLHLELPLDLSFPTVRILFRDSGNVEASDPWRRCELCTLEVLTCCVCSCHQTHPNDVHFSVSFLYTRACLGRVVGICMTLIVVATGALLDPAVANPSVYEMVGAAATSVSLNDLACGHRPRAHGRESNYANVRVGPAHIRMSRGLVQRGASTTRGSCASHRIRQLIHTEGLWGTVFGRSCFWLWRKGGLRRLSARPSVASCASSEAGGKD